MTDDERAHAIVAHLCDHGDTGKHDEICVSISAALSAARAQGIEEAAKVADRCVSERNGQIDQCANFGGDLGAVMAKSSEAARIAAAIRALPAARARSEEAVKDEELGRNVRALVEASPNGYGIGFSRDGIGYQLQRADGTYVEHADGIDFASLDAAVAAARRGQ